MYETVLADLRARGYTVTRGEDAGEPPALATGGDAPAGLGDAPLAVEPVGPDPTELVERAAHGARHDRAVLYVAAPDDAGAVREVIAEPRFVASARDGLRVFHHVPDRIRLPDDSYAAVRATPPTPRYGESARASADRVLAWREEPGDGGESRLVLEANRRVVATLGSVDSLTCLDSTDAFPYRYARRDGSFRVRKGDREVGRFPGVAAMREGGYMPVPVPLVPEHHLRWGTPAMGLAVAGEGGVRYESV
ncbi:hypothetical protein [Halosegnis marinus]|uniref:Uncharacterized protein n=1 Tax=Halosegnis marinus TaxID=3034023 RepID=A0ABD5ZP55_9EURY|nr:hypothetical protein [Halosegnis sp. DT85]